MTETTMPDAKAYYLRRVSDASAQLERDLNELRLATDRNLTALRAGHQLSSFGSLLGQRPGDVNTSFARLNTLLEMSWTVGATAEELTAAYTLELKTP